MKRLFMLALLPSLLFGQGMVMMSAGSPAFEIQTNQGTPNEFTMTVKGVSGKIIRVDWGDGTFTNNVFDGSGQALSRSYAGTATYNVSITGALSSLNELTINESTLIMTLANLGKLTGLTKFSSTASFAVTGNLSQIPRTVTYFYCTGSNTVSGDIANLPANLTYFYCYGSNTVSGDIANLPANLTTFSCTGSNTVSGDIANLPANLTTFYCTGSNTVSDYTSGRTWANNQNQFYIRQAVGYGLSSAEVDSLLINMSLVATWTGTKQIDVRGENAARSSASDAAKATLEGKGVTVLTN